MKKQVLLCCLLATVMGANAQWKPVGDKIKTKWAEQINPAAVLPEYPRPAMERAEWKNLNGEWAYAIREKGGVEPAAFDGTILVPFAVESSLSGVQKTVGEKNELWYKRTFTVPASWKGKQVMLNFGAVDWKTDVFVNDILIGSHQGGFTPFSFDVTPYLVNKGEQKLVVRVWDPTEKGFQPIGKQTSRPEGIWYTAVTGIWQTVWLEPVAVNHVTAIKAIPDVDKELVDVTVSAAKCCAADYVEVAILDGGKQIATAKGVAGKALRLAVKSPKLWSPENPVLYDMKVSLFSNGKKIDEVSSYTAMRKISTKRDANGIMRMQLNNKDYFQFGPLDQGWWPDGLYTAPTDEALRYDVVKTKDFGFNMIRKHVKVEPARWYMHCDQLGIIVWQDMPNGDRSPEWQMREYFTGAERLRSPESEANYRKEWKEIMDYLYSYPSIGVWVPFNEAWGQFKTQEIVEWTKQYDPSRLVNPASGGNHYHLGDLLDLHNYPHPEMYLYDGQRATVLGEYGGIGWANKEHLWEPDRNWGYVQFNSSNEVTNEYIKYAEQLKQMIRQGFSAAVYTQTTDVEVEVNGLMTYDRAVVKIDEGRVRKVNQEICHILND